jgi:hypothetical protein
VFAASAAAVTAMPTLAAAGFGKSTIRTAPARRLVALTSVGLCVVVVDEGVWYGPEARDEAHRIKLKNMILFYQDTHNISSSYIDMICDGSMSDDDLE